MLFNTKHVNAVAIMYYLDSIKSSRLVTSEELAENLGVNEHYLQQIALKLKRAGFIEGKKGKTGGYKISDLGRTTSTIDIIAKVYPATINRAIRLKDGEVNARVSSFFANCQSQIRAGLARTANESA